MELKDFQDKITMPETAANLQKYMKSISEHFGNYEERESQKNMIRSIVKSFKLGEHALIEAPTGTGKSLAYLLAFLAVWEQFEWKFEDDEVIERKPKMCIATNTIALQEQLMEKDIPAFRDILGVDFKTALIKGRSNYICNKNMKKLVEQPELALLDSLEDVQQFNSLKDEVVSAKGMLLKGDRSKLKTKLSNSVWEKVSTDSSNCVGNACPFYSECFFFEAKKENAKADILITNHAMFFADLKVKMETNFEVPNLVLPDHDFIVFDEAHNLEDVASNFLGTTISRSSVKRLCTDIKTSISTGDLSEEIVKEMELQHELEGVVSRIEDINEAFFKEVVNASFDTRSGKIQNQTRLLQSPESFKSHITDVRVLFDELSTLLKKIGDVCEFSEEANTTLGRLFERSESLQKNWLGFIRQDQEDFVYWTETPERPKISSQRHLFASICMSPISVSPTLKSNLFDRVGSAVLTSATLGTDNLNHMASRLGISRYIGAMYHSPFDYAGQSRLYVPQKALNPKHKDFDTYAEAEIKKLIETSKGRTLVLFTSYYNMNNMAKNLGGYIQDDLGYTLLKQGDMQRTPLINAFRDDTSSVLFATASYWEGIDVQGEALSSVIIVKLPFDVPSQPIFEARLEYLRKNGGNPFADYQVPMAIMKFKQGFGRLIRSTKDTGVVTILDNRLVAMQYGQQFLNSLPPMPVTRNFNEIEEFFAK